MTGRDEDGQRRLRADGFMYFVRGEPLFLGRTIDSILEDRLLACLASQDSTIDSLAFVPGTAVYLGESLAQVTANVRYVHRCETSEADWAGEVLAIVERRYLEDGWRIRQISELW